jgi:hypothetical protein
MEKGYQALGACIKTQPRFLIKLRQAPDPTILPPVAQECLALVVRHSPLDPLSLFCYYFPVRHKAIHHSPFTIHYSLLTIHY